MLLVNARNMPGIHQRIPATAPSSLRKVNTRLSFSTREAISCVVVIQTRPIIGSLTSTTGPAARNLSIAAAGSRKKSWLVKSMCSVTAGRVGWLIGPIGVARLLLRFRRFRSAPYRTQECGGLPQFCLELARIDAVSLHHGLDDGIRQHVLQARFAKVGAHAVLLPSTMGVNFFTPLNSRPATAPIFHQTVCEGSRACILFAGSRRRRAA